MSDLNLLALFEKVDSLKPGPTRKPLKCRRLGKKFDESQIHGFGSFRELLDVLKEEFPWPRDQMAVPAALAVFTPAECRTQGNIPAIRKAIAEVEGFAKAGEPMIEKINQGFGLISQALGALDSDATAAARADLAHACELLRSSASLDGASAALDEALQSIENGDEKKAKILAKEALIALPKKPQVFHADRAWEFAMVWLLGATGRKVDWDSAGWAGPMGAWSTLQGIVLDSVTLTCKHLGGTIGGPNFIYYIQAAHEAGPKRSPHKKGPSGWQARGERVPHFGEFVDNEHYAKWTDQICEALTGRGGARCLCSELHRLYLENPEDAKRKAEASAEKRGIQKVERLASANARAKIRTHNAWHHISAWDGVYPLFPFLMRAVRGGFKEIDPKQIPAGMLGYLLRQDLNWHEVPVAVKRCPGCGEKDIVSLDLDRCDQCGTLFASNTWPIAISMSILLGKGGGFRREEVRICDAKDCGTVFPKTSAACPKCGSEPKQRAFFAYFFEKKEQAEEVAPPTVREKDYSWIMEAVSLKIEKDPSCDFTKLSPLPDWNILCQIPGVPPTSKEAQVIWASWEPHLEGIADFLRENREEFGQDPDEDREDENL